MSLLEFQYFVKRYGPKLILKMEGQTWQPGLHVIQGPNGSGKSTLLKALAGLIPFEGEVFLEDKWNLRKHPRKQREWVSYCEAEPVFPPFLRGKYLTDLFLRYKKGTADQQMRLQEKLGIAEFPEQKISAYSSGMKKKLALLLAFTGNPKLILLDEPFATLDKEAQSSLCELILDKCQQETSFVLTTHRSFPQDLPIDQYWHIHQQQLQPGIPA